MKRSTKSFYRASVLAFGEKQVSDMFRRCDVVVITLPHVPSTEKLIGKNQLVVLPKHAYLVNVGRGEVVDEPCLIELLKSGAIAGAALDVFTQEPLPASSPFWDMRNVLVMPHIASMTTRQAERASDVLIENLRRDLNGEPLLNLIDKKLMY